MLSCPQGRLKSGFVFRPDEADTENADSDSTVVEEDTTYYGPSALPRALFYALFFQDATDLTHVVL